jgi:hypothetical protein
MKPSWFPGFLALAFSTIFVFRSEFECTFLNLHPRPLYISYCVMMTYADDVLVFLRHFNVTKTN